MHELNTEQENKHELGMESKVRAGYGVIVVGHMGSLHHPNEYKLRIFAI